VSIDARTLALLERLDGRTIEMVERLARIEVELVQVHREQRHAQAERQALLQRIDALEADADRRKGEARAALGIGSAGGVAGVLALVRAGWEWLTATGGGH